MICGLAAEIEKHILPNPPTHLGVAVSGGSDSLALLHLLHGISQAHGFKLCAVSVDHGLRAAAAEETAYVRQICRGLDLHHDILYWKDWDGQGNQQNMARMARYRLITKWARKNDIDSIALGHTQDDQAETVLMRLARGSGVNGLAAMTPRRMREGVTWMRPMLALSRVDLQEYLRHRNVSWIDDPSNDDPRYDRIKARNALEILAPLGVDAAALGQVASNMAHAREALDWQTFLEARRMVQLEAGAVRINWRAFRTLPTETARRMIVQALAWISGSVYPPRREAVLRLVDALKRDSSYTIDGCQGRRVQETAWLFRELNAVRAQSCGIDAVWDNRWHLKGGITTPDLQIKAVGENGLLQCPDWRSVGLPRDVLLATPGVWKGDELIAAPLANHAQGWQAYLENGEDAFFAALLSH